MRIKELNDNQYNFIDIILKLIAGIFIASTAVAGIIQFKISTERDFLMVLYKDEIQSIKELNETTAKLSVYPKTSPLFMEADSTFDQLRTGKISFLCDSILYKQVTRFYIAKEKYKSGSDAITKEHLHSLSHQIANYSRIKILNTMKLDEL